MIKYKLAQAFKEETVKRRKRILKWVIVTMGVLWLAINFTCAYPIFGWHPHACLCQTCLEKFESGRR